MRIKGKEERYKTELLSLMDRTQAEGLVPQEVFELTMDILLEKSLADGFNYCCTAEIMLIQFTRWYQNQHNSNTGDEDEEECGFYCDCGEFDLPELSEPEDEQTVH
ncbi:MAG: hypothetical protein ACE5GM_00825 [bacterium]